MDSPDDHCRNTERAEADYVTVTPELLTELRGFRKRTGVGVRKLLRPRDDWPEGLTAGKGENLYYGQVNAIRRDHLEYLIRLWRELPGLELVALTPEMLRTLRAHIERTGKGASAILRGARAKPEGLKASTITTWFRGKTPARKDHLDYVLNLYATAHERIPVTPAIRAEMSRHMRRTGVSPEALLRSKGRDCAERLRSWMRQGTARLANKEEVKRILELWRALPDRHPGKQESITAKIPKPAARVALKPDIRAR